MMFNMCIFDLKYFQPYHENIDYTHFSSLYKRSICSLINYDKITKLYGFVCEKRVVMAEEDFWLSIGSSGYELVLN